MGALQTSLPLVSAADVVSVERVLRDTFDAWLKSKPAAHGRRMLRTESAQIYRDMWLSFVDFCLPVHPTESHRWLRLNPLEKLTLQDLRAFLAHPVILPGEMLREGGLSDRYALRMLQLLDRILSFAAGLSNTPAPAAVKQLMEEEPYRYASAAERDPLPDVLTDAQVKKLIDYVTGVSAPRSATNGWKPARDCTAIALMLGAGLSPGEVRALTLADVTIEGGHVHGEPWRLMVKGDAVTPERQTPIAPWAGRLLAHWLATRRVTITAGEWVLPSTASGKRWGHPACHRACVAVLDQAGIPGGAPFRLRHTFAVRQLRTGCGEEDVARWMGYADTKPLKRYRHLLTRPVAVL